VLLDLSFPLLLAAALPQAEYVLDSTQSTLLVVTRKDAKAAFASAAHDHVVRASKLEGKVSYDPSAPESCHAKIVVQVADLVADEPEMRKKIGLKGDLLAKNRDDILEAMRAEDQLDAKRFPTITFEAKKCSGPGGASGTIQVDGELTIRGKTKALSTPIKFRIEGRTLFARGRFTATHADFGFEPYSAALGTIRNAQELTFFVDVRGSSQ
jgi:polyisoprenoid-binding protein YceI